MSPQRDSKRRSVDNASGDAVLIVDGGPRDGDVVTLSHGTSVLGRHDECDIVLGEAAASREHALIVEADAGYHLRDLSSTNGTFVNRHRLGGELHLLRHGDILHFGANTISYRFHHARASTLQLSTVDAAPDAVMVDAKARHVYGGGPETGPARVPEGVRPADASGFQTWRSDQPRRNLRPRVARADRRRRREPRD